MDCWLGFLWETQLGTLLEILLLERHWDDHSQLLGSRLWDWKLVTGWDCLWDCLWGRLWDCLLDFQWGFLLDFLWETQWDFQWVTLWDFQWVMLWDSPLVYLLG